MSTDFQDYRLRRLRTFAQRGCGSELRYADHLADVVDGAVSEVLRLLSPSPCQSAGVMPRVNPMRVMAKPALPPPTIATSTFVEPSSGGLS